MTPTASSVSHIPPILQDVPTRKRA